MIDVEAFVAELASSDAAARPTADEPARAIAAGAGSGVGSGGPESAPHPATSPDGEADWPDHLEEQLAGATVEELQRTHIAVEVYYGTMIRAARGPADEDYWLRQAYRRIINLLMRFIQDMGFSQQELSFVSTVLDRSGAGRSARILEVGCGSGSLLLALAERGYTDLHGIDFAPAAVARARQRAQQRGLAVRIDQATMDNLIAAGLGASYDLLLICDVLEHVVPARVGDFLAQLHALLTPGGTLVVVTPNRLSGPHDITREILPRGAEPTGLHLREYTLGQVCSLLTTNGFVDHTAALFTGAGADGAAIGVSTAAVRVKLAIEPVLRRLPFGLRAPVIERMYFKAVAARTTP